MSRSDLAAQFERTLARLLAREAVDLYAVELNLTFEAMAGTLFGNLAERKGCYFDGVVGMTSEVKTKQKVEFSGEMWVGRDDGEQWTEPFRATAVDKRITKQGIWITVGVGSNRAEAELWAALGVKGYESASQSPSNNALERARER